MDKNKNLSSDLTDVYEEYAVNYNAIEDFDYVISLYDLKEILPRISGKDFLILGESSGVNTELLYKYANSLDIVDASRVALKRTKKILDPLDNKANKISYHHSFWMDYNTDKKYSDIFFIRGLEHELNSRKLLSKLKGILADEGTIHIIVPNAHSLHRYIMKFKRELKSVYDLRPRDYEIGHVKYYDKNLLKDELLSNGFEIKTLHGFFLKPFRNKTMSKFTMNRNNLLVKICYLLGKVFPNYGTQLYCAARKLK